MFGTTLSQLGDVASRQTMRAQSLLVEGWLALTALYLYLLEIERDPFCKARLCLREMIRHPAHLSVHAGDRIVAVNGFAHDAQAGSKAQGILVFNATVRPGHGLLVSRAHAEPQQVPAASTGPTASWPQAMLTGFSFPS